MIMLYNNVIVFPRLTGELIAQQSTNCFVDSRQMSGRYLIRKITDAILQGDVSTLPDIAIYDVDKKKWRDIYVPIEETRSIKTKTETFTYYPKLMSLGNWSLIASWLGCHSDAKVKLV